MTNLINTALDIYQIVLQSRADKREYRDIDNNVLFQVLCLNNELLNKIFNMLNISSSNNYSVGKEREMMCNALIQKASEEQVKKFAMDTMAKIKMYDKDMYDELMMSLYKDMYGCHFNEWMLNKALESMVNEDGTTGGHWKLDQTNGVARQYDIEFNDFNQYDWNYVMNMVYSDYYGAVSNDTSAYVKLAKHFIMDKDAPKGKALYYYWAMKY